MGNRLGNSGNSVRLYFFWASESLQMVIAAMKLKRHLLLGRKAMTNLDSILKSRDISLLIKVHVVKAIAFPVVTYGCENWIPQRSLSSKELMLSNCGAEEDTQESLGLQGDQTSPS